MLAFKSLNVAFYCPRFLSHDCSGSVIFSCLRFPLKGMNNNVYLFQDNATCSELGCVSGCWRVGGTGRAIRWRQVRRPGSRDMRLRSPSPQVSGQRRHLVCGGNYPVSRPLSNTNNTVMWSPAGFNTLVPSESKLWSLQAAITLDISMMTKTGWDRP